MALFDAAGAAALQLNAACWGRLCSTQTGLDMRHLPALHTASAAALLVTAFVCHYTAAYHWLHRAKHLAWRLVITGVLIGTYMVTVLRFIPWTPYWLRELHVMVASMFAWKTLELALLRRHEVLPSLPHFLLNDALVLRPEILQDPTVLRAKQAAAKWNFQQRVQAALPQLGWALAQYVGVEAINVFLMQQPADLLAQPLWRQFLLSCLFAECLYLHLSYFFSCMCALNVLLFADAVEAWPAPFNKPYAAISPIEFWNKRWHGMFKWYFVQLIYRPVQSLIHLRGKPHPLVKALPTFAVFLASGLFHELLLWMNFGACTGEQLAFFLVHAVAVTLQKQLERAAQAVREAETGQGGMASSSYGNLTVFNGSSSSTFPAAQQARGAAPGRDHGPGAGAPLMVHITAKSTSAVAAFDQAVEEEPDTSGDDGSCCGSGVGGAPAQTPATAAGAAEGGGKLGPSTTVVRRTGSAVKKGAGVDVDARGTHRLDPQQAEVPSHGKGCRRMRQGFQGQTLLLLVGSGTEPPAVQAVRRVLQWLLFNAFLGTSLSLFFAPWFRFGYHQELRVFIPGPVHHALRSLLFRQD